MTHLLLMLFLAVETMADIEDINYDALDAAVNFIAIVLMFFLHLLHVLWTADGILFDILPEQEDAPLQLTHAKGINIDDLFNTATLKMTRFNWCELHCLYVSFNLNGQLKPMQNKLAFLMGHI